MKQEQNNPQMEGNKRNSYTGLGISFGAAFGLILGPLLFNDLILGVGVGVAVGLILGAGIDAQKKKSE